MSETSFQPIKVIAFDVFGTVFNFESISRDEVARYVSQVKEPVWRPLNLPASWGKLQAHADAAEGIARLRKKYCVVTLSNGPMDLLIQLSRQAKIDWDGIIPIQLRYTYKPSPIAYRTLGSVFPSVKAEEVLMVTANPTFGDVEAAAAQGWQSAVIRQPGGIRDVLELAEKLGT